MILLKTLLLWGEGRGSTEILLWPFEQASVANIITEVTVVRVEVRIGAQVVADPVAAFN